jgi:tetratricopeptide (TPR) repeat protein
MDLRILTIENALDIFSPEKWFICPICLEDFIGPEFLGGLILNEMISIVTAGRCYGCKGAYINCRACGSDILLEDNERYLCGCEHSWKATESSIQVKPHGLGEYRLIVSSREPHQYLETDLQWLLSNAQSLRNEGEYSKSFAIIQEALSLYPVDSSILLEKALTLDAMGKHEEALTNYDQAIELDSSQLSAFLSRGLLHLFLHNWELCIRDLDTYLSTDNPIDIGDLYRIETLRDFAKTQLHIG